VPARIARTGIQVYHDAEGREVKEFRAEDEVFAADALASFASAPITIRHPKGLVTPANWRDLAHGAVLSASDRETVDGEQYVSAQLALHTAEVLEAVEAEQLTEVSCGYTCDVLDTPGTTPEGERYDRVQTRIRANHVALLPPGHARAGRAARLTLDGHEDLGGFTTMKIRFDGAEYDTASEADMAALQRRIEEKDKARTDAEAREAALTREKGELSAKLDTALADAEKARQSVPDAVAAELTFRSDMARLLPADYDYAGKTRLAIKLDAIRRRAPKAALLTQEKPSESEVDGYLSALREQGVEDYSARDDANSNSNENDDWRSDAKSIQAEHARRTRGYVPGEAN
jgi:hypothetical protein